MTPNAAAFLAMISHSEGTDRSIDPYRVCYGYKHVIRDLSDHPVSTGEWKGEALFTLGKKYEHSISTAAGKYQLIHPTWVALKARLKLANFSGPAQDDAALELIKEHGALEAVNAGALEAAISLCVNIWASLPGSGSGQPETAFASLQNAYRVAGGLLA